MCVLGYMITCGYITSENSSWPCSRQYSVVLNEVQAIITSQNYYLEKRGTVGDRVQMICVLMEMKCTEKWSGLNCESCDLCLHCIL